MTGLPDVAAWHACCLSDPVLARWLGDVSFAIEGARFHFADGRTDAGGDAAFALHAPAEAWVQFFTAVPPRHHHNFFAMLARAPGTSMSGDEMAFRQHAHVVRRVLDIGRWVATGHNGPAPVSQRPSAGPTPIPRCVVQYVQITAGGRRYSVYYETAGDGRDTLCLHTAGSDARQFHRLMSDARLTARHRLVAFDLPWHGRSPAADGAPPGLWRLSTDLYVDLIMGFVEAAKLSRPIVLGASMSGEICLELALRHPESFSAIIACEACDRVEGRFMAWGSHPAINAGFFVPEWIYGLMAPQSPAECAAEVAWHYAQSGPGVFTGDIAFYAGSWDARERVAKIDTARCPLFMLTGEYDYSCTAEMSEATAAKIRGARFQRMNGIGHFPFAENPPLFAQYLHPVLSEIA